MPQTTLGYMELEWTCPNCGTKNPGLQKTCKSCGSPQPENVQFGVGEQPKLLKDEQKITQAEKGPDFHCPYCGTRNPADARTCSQCGGDLTGAAQRASGGVVGETANAQAGAAAAGTNPPQTATPSKFRLWMLLPVAVLALACCALFGFLFFHTDKVTGSVQSVRWERTVPIQELRDVTQEDWKDQLPQGAKVLSCNLKYRDREDGPAANATEVCSTELVDKGNGAAEVVQTCYYEVYDDYCKYTAQQWQQVNQAVARGNDLNPTWPQVSLGAGQREGQRKATYTAQFQTDKGLKEYTTDDETLFGQFQPGSTWTLDINSLGAIVGIQP
ncbi:MAG: zinc ribbon domain-containing protein [Anaerolineales bacterium]